MEIRKTQDGNFDTFARFVDCYWAEDGTFEYGNLENALVAFVEIEHISETINLLSDIKGILDEQGFPESRNENPGYSDYLHGLNYSTITNDEAKRLITILEKSVH